MGAQHSSTENIGFFFFFWTGEKCFFSTNRLILAECHAKHLDTERAVVLGAKVGEPWSEIRNHMGETRQCETDGVRGAGAKVYSLKTLKENAPKGALTP